MNKPNLVLLASLAACSPGVLPADVPAELPFAWLSGHWCSQAENEVVEEYWMPSKGDLALGLSRTQKAGKTTSFEFLRIQREGNSYAYVAQPQGSPPTSFRLTASGADWARFENPQHDFPVRVDYRRTPAGLNAGISGPDGRGGETVIAFQYRPCPD